MRKSYIYIFTLAALLSLLGLLVRSEKNLICKVNAPCPPLTLVGFPLNASAEGSIFPVWMTYLGISIFNFPVYFASITVIYIAYTKFVKKAKKK